MKKWMLALASGALMTLSAQAADTAKSDDMLSHLMFGASGDSWSVMNAKPQVFDDAGVQAGKATRVAAHKSANPWDVQAQIFFPKPVQKGDVILVVFYARVETPPAGSTTAIIPTAGIALNKPPYTFFASEPASPTSKWAVYYASGVADDDHAKGSINFGVHLAAADQVVDLGPVFVFNFGPDYDRSKLPHNKLAAAAPPPASAQAPESVYAADLAKIRAKLPVKATLINDPGLVYTYGPDISGESLTAAEVTAGKATRTVTAKAAAHPYDDGISSPVNGAIKKGDVIFTAVQVRIAVPTAGTATGLIPEFGVHLAAAPYTSVATASATAPNNQWTWLYASGIATADYAAGTTGVLMQLGAGAQTVDIGPVIVLDLGPGIDPETLPNNFGKPH